MSVKSSVVLHSGRLMSLIMRYLFSPHTCVIRKFLVKIKHNCVILVKGNLGKLSCLFTIYGQNTKAVRMKIHPNRTNPILEQLNPRIATGQPHTTEQPDPSQRNSPTPGFGPIPYYFILPLYYLLQSFVNSTKCLYNCL